MLTIVVTGAAGFIGSHTCDALLAAGHKVIAVDNLRTGKKENLAQHAKNPNLVFCEHNIAVPSAIANVVARFEPHAIIHLAALVSVPESIRDPGLNFFLNVEMPQHVIVAAANHHVKRVVFASSAAVYGDNDDLPLSERSETRPISPYGGAKLACEGLMMGHGAAHGVTVRCLRYFNVFGPRQDPKSPYSGVISVFTDKFRAGQAPTIFGDGEQTRDFVSVYDVARANVLAATLTDLKSGVTNICTGQPTSLNTLAKHLRRAFEDRRARKPESQRAGLSAEGSAKVELPEPIHAAPREGDIRHSLGSPAKATQDIGWTPKVTLEAGLAELAAAV